MPFSPETAEKLLVACHRHCCVCHKPAGTKMEIHHIVPRAEGGDDSEENGIPLCFDCHAEVAAYNANHPKGRRFTASELRKHKLQWFATCAKAPWHQTVAPIFADVAAIAKIDDRVFESLRVDDRRPAQALAGAVALHDRFIRQAFAGRVLDGLKSGDEETRWKFAMLVEEMVLWTPDIVPSEVIEDMSRDPCFSVRSSAAMCYYHLARFVPASVSLDVLTRLAAYNEDWYVHTPAVAALLRLARPRPVVPDIFACWLNHEDEHAREHAASAIWNLVHKEPDLIPMGLLETMSHSEDAFIKEVGQKGMIIKKKEEEEKPSIDYSPF